LSPAPAPCREVSARRRGGRKRFAFKNFCQGAKNDAMLEGSAQNEATGRKASYEEESREKSKII
jgi:hypothetical protein